jgi:MFS family permease
MSKGIRSSVEADRPQALRLRLPLGVLNKDLKLLFACNLAGSFGDGLYAYLLPVYMTETLKAGPVEVGILYAVTSLFAALTLLIAGVLADRYDRKKIMIAGWIAWLPVPLIFAFAGNWIQMLPGMVMWGFWLGGPTTTAYITSIGSRNKLTLTFTMISAAWSIGYTFSPALGGYLAGIIGMRSVFLLAFVFYAVACSFLTLTRSQYPTNALQRASGEKYSLIRLLRTRKLLKLSAFFASAMFILMMFRPFIPKYLVDVYHYGALEIGVLGSVSFASSAILGILLGKLGDKWRKSYALALAMASCSVSLIMLLLFGDFRILLVTSLFAGGSYLMWSLMNAVVGPLAPEACSARWVSVPQTISMFSSFVAPYTSGILYSASPLYPFVISIGAATALALIAATGVLEK